MLFSFTNVIVLAKSDGCDALTEYIAMFPSLQGKPVGVKGSQLWLSTAGAMIEEEDSSLTIVSIRNISWAVLKATYCKNGFVH